MKALITGASSGIGREMAIILSEMGYDLVLVARRKRQLEELKKQLNTDVQIIPLDVSSTLNCMKLYHEVKSDDIEIVINNAGVGVFGEFTETNLQKELDMIDINVKAVHILTKLFLKDMRKKNGGYILNVSSSAAFSPGPLMASYYASKSYVLRLTESIYGELKRDNSHVYIGVLCPGPVKTDFNKVAGIQFSMQTEDSKEVAKYAINKMFQRKLVIVPGVIMKFCHVIVRFLPMKLLIKIMYCTQRKKAKINEK